MQKKRNTIEIYLNQQLLFNYSTRYCIVFCRLSLPVDGAELPTAVSKNVPYLPLDIPIKYKVYI